LWPINKSRVDASGTRAALAGTSAIAHLFERQPIFNSDNGNPYDDDDDDDYDVPKGLCHTARESHVSQGRCCPSTRDPSSTLFRSVSAKALHAAFDEVTGEPADSWKPGDPADDKSPK